VEGRGGVLVKSGALAAGFITASVTIVELRCHRRVVGYSKAIDVEKTVAGGDFVFGC